MRPFTTSPATNLCAAVASTVATATLCAAAPPADRRVVAYYPSWAIYARDVHVADLPAEQTSDLVYAFADVSADGECAHFDRFADVEQVYPGEDPAIPYSGNFGQLTELKAAHPHLRTVLSVGGWTLSTHFSDAAASPAAREDFIESCVAMMLAYGFDGLDFDWEFPVSGGLPTNVTRPEDRENLTALVAATRARLDAEEISAGRPLSLSLAVPAVPALAANFDLAALADDVDWVFLMAYDLQGPWSPVTAFAAPLFAPGDGAPASSDTLNAAAAVARTVDAGVPSDKVVLGVPLFGRGFSNVGADADGLFQPFSGVPEGTYEAGIFDYADLAANYVGWFDRFWHDDARAPWLHHPIRREFISYDDRDSVLAKGGFAVDANLGGLGAWQVAMDDPAFTLTHAMHGAVAANCPAQPREGCAWTGKAKLSIVSDGTEARMRVLLARTPQAHTTDELGAPTERTTHTVCVYDTATAVAQAKLLPGPDWKAAGPSGYKFRSNGPVARAKFAVGSPKRTKFVVNARGTGELVPPLPMQSPLQVTVQVANNTTDACWQSEFQTAARNSAERFVAKR